MKRLKLTLEYDGTAFYGYQRQTNPPVRTVQGTLEDSLKKILSVEELKTAVCGRTDRGVHSLGNVMHLDVEDDVDTYKLMGGLNHLCKPGLAVVSIDEVDEDFHARASCYEREYVYKMHTRRQPSPVREGRVAHVVYKVDFNVMKKAAESLLGEHDFSAFRAARCESSTPMCNLTKLELTKVDDEIHVRIAGNHFLYNMVRIICGTLVDIGRGELPAGAMDEILASKDRRKAGITLLPAGLYFVEAKYR
ncbi:MAG: tRNA pseudouridine(38-40) synthase TruA [Alphaproteobacteria bacterium]|nr:tRNA pseudouridine(38-40) synthase TruA [Alphaproteobacteria bacterium]